MLQNETRRAFLGMPGYGELTAGAAQGLYRSSRLDKARHPLTLSITYQRGSLLAQNFNGLWCVALNKAHTGERLDYFAMLHSDVAPEAWWLDKLIDELESRELDVLGVVVPIKDDCGSTSIALDGDDKWMPKCRLTMKEIHRLPETFTEEDAGHPLLLNTGCWVCRFSMEWARKYTPFTINDRIIFDTNRNMYRAQVEPEDWYFSRMCNGLGLRVGATRKIRLAHQGPYSFYNDRIWGDEYDKAFVSESQISKKGFELPNIDGWLMHEEGKALAELARGKRVLEIGSYCGKSTVCMARTAEHVTAVDYFDGRDTPAPGDTSKAFRDNLDRYGVADKVTTKHPDEPLCGEYDLAFIDGAHDRESVHSDIDKSLSVLAPGGLLAFHDYREFPGQHDSRWDQGVTESVRELINAGAELVSTHATVAVVRPPANILSEV
jgi:predicted O-methyltransferase YrrM